MLKSTPLLLRAAAGIAAAALVAACGSNSPSSRTSASSQSVTVNGRTMSQAAANREMVRFADCMRAHGVANFPDPTTDPHAFKQAFNTNSPAFGSAMGHCQQLLPSGGPSGQNQARSQRQINAMLAFARCMRGHGFSRFPDPTSNGSVTHQMIAQAGIDLHQPAVVRSADTCTAVTHGVITRAIVARFIAGQ